ncbi:MAG: glycosyl hydrolase family protein [Melioribacter sp.]|nr:glycosyl hydrolase family protein [Melioribacter sp.]
MNKTISLLFGTVLFTSVSLAQNYQLIWSDEFNSTNINTSNWTYDIGGHGWGNNELEYYTNRTENAKVVNGNLLIIARKESYGSNNYTSARLKTQGLKSFTYGKIEANIKLPSGKGLWPAFWMLGNNITQVSWPKCGEIDIMEHINTSSIIYGTMHWDNNGHVSSGGNYWGVGVQNFHVYSIEWNPQSINWFVDGSKYWSVNITNGVSNTGAFHQPFFIILNLAVGGNWPGNPDSTTPMPDSMFVDYVRVYQTTPTNVEKTQQINNFSLEQNYPNPFNPLTIIKYSIADAGNVSIKVFDLLGKEVTQLVNKYHQEGNFSVQFDASKLSSGVYIYSLSSGSFYQSRKLMLIK